MSAKDLEKYNEKRDFSQTSEPSGETVIRQAQGDKSKLRFVIHKHDATNLHYDLRLEIDGVLRSWAVPKGLPTEVGEKHLAMQVEDHPFPYKDFEGVIPEGNYGAGPVMIWDEGYYHHITTEDPEETQEIIKRKMAEEGEFKFILHGKKLKGEFAMFRFKKAGDQAWLIIKHQDENEDDHKESQNNKRQGWEESARSGLTMAEIRAGKSDEVSLRDFPKTSIPAKVKPMLATLISVAPEGSNWIYELKWDGYRVIASKKGKKVELHSRNGNSFTGKFPEIEAALARIDYDFVIDGEVVINDDDGIPNFGLVKEYMGGADTNPPAYYVFDLLHWEGHSLLDAELRQRRHLLEQYIPESKVLKISIASNNLKQMLAFAREHGLEGLLAKDLTSKYALDTRSQAWQKLKLVKEDEFVIVGYIPKGDLFKSLALGRFSDGELEYCGQVGSGYTDEYNRELLGQLRKLEIAKGLPGCTDEIQPVEAKLLAQVRYGTITKDGQIRHAVFQGLREDKSVAELRKESKQKSQKYDFPIEVTNTDKIYFPELGLTKGDVIGFYDQMSEYILPYLAGRPVSMHRHPDGIHGQSFFHKDFEQDHPDWLHTVDIARDKDDPKVKIKARDENGDKEITYIVCDNRKSLLFLANLGVIELHTWYSRVGNLDKPDFMLFDLDPGDGVTNAQLQEIALALHDYLDNLQVENLIKTSGKKGLHVYSPLNKKYSYEQARDFVKLVAIKLSEKYPQLVTVDRDPDARRGKIYIDYPQNRHGHTTVSVYSLRPNEFAGVSMPLTWKEVEQGFDPKDFNYHTALPRLKKVGDLWEDVLGKGIDMGRALEILGEVG